MPRSSDIGLLTKLNELYSRYGLRATDCDTEFGFISSEHDPEGEGYFYIEFPGMPCNPEIAQKYYRVIEALGFDERDPSRKFDHPSELEDLLDHALSLAPRARVR